MTLLKTLADDFCKACTACGACAAMCPALAAAGMGENPSAIQIQVKHFLAGDPPGNAVVDRALLCNECYQCTVDICPEGLDPMRTNLLLRGYLRDQEAWPQGDFIKPSDSAADERVLAGLLTTEEEFQRITTPLTKGDGRFLFFPGCNVYSMPDKLLTAMDIMDKFTDNWTYLPGLANCCGGNHSTAGDLEAEQAAMKGLIEAFQRDEYEAIVLWCPTCVTRFHLSDADLPTVSFARFVADRLAGQEIAQGNVGPITLHDACKIHFLGIDIEAPRELLARITGETVREMPRENVCCGYGLLAGSPEDGRRWIQSRLEEASDTGAGTMVNICHGCHWLFTGPEWSPDIRIANYVTLAGQAMGIKHEERFLKWRRWGDPVRIMADIGDRINQFPWPKDRIEAVIRKAFAPEMATESSS
jgi:Fe-S oxidoreductase